jgi:hypothetical protein
MNLACLAHPFNLFFPMASACSFWLYQLSSSEGKEEKANSKKRKGPILIPQSFPAQLFGLSSTILCRVMMRCNMMLKAFR